MKEYLRRKLIHWLTKDLFNAITADDERVFTATPPDVKP